MVFYQTRSRIGHTNIPSICPDMTGNLSLLVFFSFINFFKIDMKSQHYIIKALQSFITANSKSIFA